MTRSRLSIRVIGQWCKYALRTIIAEDGTEISRTFHRHVLAPDADLTAEDADVAAIAGQVFTDAVKAAYAARPTE